ISAVFIVSGALAQEKELIDAPTPNLSTQANRASLTFQQAVTRSFEDPHWYWEGGGATGAPSVPYRCFTCRKISTHQGGFSPGKLVWNLSGKHKLLPIVDLSVIKLTPGEPTLIQQKPPSEYGTVVAGRSPTRLWNKATQSLMNVMRK